MFLRGACMVLKMIMFRHVSQSQHMARGQACKLKSMPIAFYIEPIPSVSASCPAPEKENCGAGGLFGVSALTFGKWQLFASLGAVVFRTIGGPTLLSSVLRTPGRRPCHPLTICLLTPAKLCSAYTHTVFANFFTAVVCHQFSCSC